MKQLISKIKDTSLAKWFTLAMFTLLATNSHAAGSGLPVAEKLIQLLKDFFGYFRAGGLVIILIGVIIFAIQILMKKAQYTVFVSVVVLGLIIVFAPDILEWLAGQNSNWQSTVKGIK